MREEDTDWFKRMAARARKTVRHDLLLIAAVIGVMAVLAMCLLLAAQ